MEVLKEGDKLDLVAPKDRLNLWWLLWVGDKDLVELIVEVKLWEEGGRNAKRSACCFPPSQLVLHSTNLENMECLELNILAPIFEQIHHHLEVILVGNVAGHDFEVCSVEKNLA